MESCGIACPSSSSVSLDDSPSSGVDTVVLGTEYPTVCLGSQSRSSARVNSKGCESLRATLNCPSRKGSLLGDPTVPFLMAQLLQRQGCGGVGTASWTQKMTCLLWRRSEKDTDYTTKGKNEAR